EVAPGSASSRTSRRPRRAGSVPHSPPRSARSGRTQAHERSMNAKDLLRAERARLCDTLERYGPGAPTLCAGWSTDDLAAHLVVRERDPRSGPGLVLGGRAAEYTNRLRLRARAKGYPWLLERLRAGPPTFVLVTMAGLNVNENWIHHEDVRRANGEAPRPVD